MYITGLSVIGVFLFLCGLPVIELKYCASCVETNVYVCTCVEIIDDIIDHTDVTNTRLISETRHIKLLDRKSGACCTSHCCETWSFCFILYIMPH